MVTLALFFLRKWRDDHRSPYLGGNLSRRSQRLGSTDALAPQNGRSYSHGSGLNTYAYPAPNSATIPTTPHEFMPPSGQYQPHPFTFPNTRANSNADPGSPHTDGAFSQAQRQKAAVAGITAYKPSRFIVHTDVEEAAANAEEEVVELPPQYTDRRQPPTDVKQQPSSSGVNRQPSSVRRRPSGNVAPHEIPLPFTTSTSPRPPPLSPIPTDKSWI